MTAALAAFSLQHEIEHYGAYAGIAAVFGLGILSLLYFAQAREVKRLREWAGRAPERAAELEARVTADAQRRVAPAPPVAPRPTAPATPAAQQAGPAPTPGIAAPATVAAAAGATATTVAKPGTPAPQNGTGSNAAVPPPGTEVKPGDGKDGEAKEDEGKEDEGKKPEEAGAAPPAGEDKPFGPQPKPTETGDKPPVPAATAAAVAGAAGAAGAAAAASPSAGAAAPSADAGPAPAAAPATPPSTPPPPPGRQAPLRAPMPSASLPPRTPAGARPRTDAGDGRSRGRLAAIVGAVVGVIAVLAVAGILIFGGGGDKPAPKPNTVAQPTTDTAASGASTPAKAPVKLNRKAVPLAVLNGTTVTGLARGAADKLTAKGYNEPNVVTNDTTNQQRPTTQVYYEAKAHAAALDVAKILGVPTSQIKPMDANARALADRAQVAVFVGGDKAQ
ncbi:MAG TPA: LytR C-terminal domain-containing protein [Solirubrobacteraceae bacterium]